MKAKQIVKIVVCSVLALIFITIFGIAMLASSAVDFFSDEISLEFSDVFVEDKSFSVGGAEITQPVKNLEIDWAAGQIIVRAYDGETLRFSEGLSREMGGYVPGTEDIPSEYAPEHEDALRYKMVNGTLTIRAEKSTWSFFGINEIDNINSKVLLVLVPQGELDSIDIDNAAAAVELEGLTLDKADLDTAAGNIYLEDCKVSNLEVDSAAGSCQVVGEVDRFNMDTATGNVTFQGSLERLEMDSATANLLLSCETAPERIDFNSASGNADISLPASSEFEAELDSALGDLTVSDFAVKMENGKYVVGSGAASYNFDTASGDINIFCGE